MRIKRPVKRNISITFKTDLRIRKIIEEICLVEGITLTTLIESSVLKNWRNLVKKNPELVQRLIAKINERKDNLNKTSS